MGSRRLPKAEGGLHSFTDGADVTCEMGSELDGAGVVGIEFWGKQEGRLAWRVVIQKWQAPKI